MFFPPPLLVEGLFGVEASRAHLEGRVLSREVRRSASL